MDAFIKIQIPQHCTSFWNPVHFRQKLQPVGVCVMTHEQTVLVVEDDRETLDGLLDGLHRAGYRVESSENGWEAIKKLRQIAPSVVLTELHLAEADGSSLREKLFLNPGMRDVPFFYLLNTGQSARDVRSLRHGVDDFVIKPVDPMLLIARLQSVIERRRLFDGMMRVDPLTRLLNQSTIEEEIAAELERVRRYGRNGCLALLDVDDLARVNQELGLAMGDLLLTCLASIMVSNTRNVDLSGRYQSENFLLYLPESLEAGAVTLISRLQERFVRAADAMAGLSVTLSAGIVETPRDGADFATLERRLEEALAHARTKGPASIAVWPETAGNPVK